jgi:DNA-binding SARP family transcriptional activator
MLAALRATAVVVTVLLGVPMLLVTVGGNPLPDPAPSLEQLRQWADDPMHPRYAVASARTLAWLMWATIAAAVLAVLAARVSRWRWHRLAVYLPGPVQGLAATILGAATVTTTVGAGAQAHTPATATAAVPDHQPATRASATPPASRPTMVTVRPGDTLSAIAERKLDDADRWPEIFALNRNRHFPDVGGRLRDPDLIYPGWRLRLPDQPAREPAASAPPAPAQPAPQTTPSAPTAPADTATTDTPTTRPTSEDTPAAHDSAGVSLPGGWLTLPLAAAIAAAGTMVWRQRSRTSTPASRDGHATQDPRTRALPAVMTTIRRQVREQDPDLFEVPAPQPTVAAFNATDPTDRADPPPPGPSGPDLAGITGLVTATGLGLIGPGAAAAARALLVAALSSGSPFDPDAKGHVIVTADMPHTLLDGPAPHLTGIPRLHITADLDAAITRAEDLIVERQRLLHEHDATDLTALRAEHPYHPPTPPILLLVPAPPDELHDRLTATARLGTPLNITTILIGPWPHRLTDATDGTTEGRRLAVLDTPSTRQLLTVLHEAHTGQPATSPVEATPAPVAHTDEPAATDAVRQRRSGPVRIRLLGTPEIRDTDGNPVTGLRHHARELLVYLAVHRNGARLPDIMEAFWPSATVRRAAERLSTETANLRRILRRAAGDPSIQPVVNTGGRYHLAPNLVDVDLWQLSDALRDAHTTTDTHRRATLLRHAVDAHTGTLATGYDYDWIEAPREHLRRAGVRARIALADLTGTDTPDTAATLLREATILDPLNENLAQRAMRALLAAGDQAGAREVLQHLRTALDDIDEEPQPESLALLPATVTSTTP